MLKRVFIAASAALMLSACATDKELAPGEGVEPEVVGDIDLAPVEEAAICQGFGPQTPRDISQVIGTNPILFDLAPPASELNLCNIHTHTNAEHKAPGFSIHAGPAPDGGYQCNETPDLTAAELAPAPGAYGGVQPGDTIEVHWVHSSCPVAPGAGLGSCLSEGCDAPFLRVEAQSFLVVNDPNALDFMDFIESPSTTNGMWQARAIPTGTGDPVLFRGSTTGPSYTEETCSPLQVTWSVRPQCARLDINSLHRWAESNNVFNETASHGVRDLVTTPALLSPIE